MRALLGFFFVFAFCASAHAGFFLERDAVEEEAKALDVERGFALGGGSSFSFYLGALDIALEGLLAYRFENDFGLGANVSLGISESVHEADMELDRYVGTDDFLGIGSGAVLFEKDGSYRIAPRIFVDYGRNMKPWPRARFALQAKIRISYLIGESLGRKESFTTRTANTVFSGHFALVFF